MLNQEEILEQPIRMNGQLLTTDEYQQEMANRISEEIFQTEKNAEKTAGLINSFLQSYEKHKNEQPLEKWLSAEFKKYLDIWKDEEEIHATALEVINAITISNQTKTSLNAHLDQGKSEASWLATEIEKGASATGVGNVKVYADAIDQSLQQANQKNWDVITRLDGGINQGKNLDGFIAEHHHANTFNIDATAQGSSYSAKVLERQPGATYRKNSMDIGIYDGDGKLVRRYQSKYGADADATAQLFEQGDYRGQRKLAPEGHANSKSTEVIEIEGISSKPLSKEAVKELQIQAQEAQEAKQYEWNEVNRITLSKQIGKMALMGVCISAGMQGTRILARRVWNSLTGKANPTASKDLREFFESSLKSSAHVGVQVAVSGGLVVAVKNGWIGNLLKSTPAGLIANIAYIGLENAKVLFKLNNGELSKAEALDTMGQNATTSVIAIAGAVKGAALGASLGIVLGPLGSIVGGFVGGVAGGIAGGNIGKAVYEGGKGIVKTAVHTVKEVASAINDGIRAVGSGISNVMSSLLSW